MKTLYEKLKLKLRDIIFPRENPDDIAQRGVTQVGLSLGEEVTEVGFFSENSIYRAFKDAGYSDEDARREAKARVWHID